MRKSKSKDNMDVMIDRAQAQMEGVSYEQFVCIKAERHVKQIYRWLLPPTKLNGCWVKVKDGHWESYLHNSNVSWILDKYLLCDHNT